MALLRGLLRDGAAALLHKSGVTQPVRRAAQKLTIVTFHRVLPEHLRDVYPLPGLVVTPDELAWFLRIFVARYDCGTLRDTLARWQAGDHGRPLLAITFDDGPLDNFEHARPVLGAHHVRATFFVPTAHVGTNQALYHDRLGFGALEAERRRGAGSVQRMLGLAGAEADAGSALARRVVTEAKQRTPAERTRWMSELEAVAPDALPAWAGMMDWAHLERLRDEGHEIGSHSATHALLPQCTDEELHAETTGSRDMLQQHLGGEISSFCYPNGDHDKRVVFAVARAGYTAAVVTRWGLNPWGSHLLALRRCDMYARHSRDSFGRLSEARLAWRMSGLHPGLGSS